MALTSAQVEPAVDTGHAQAELRQAEFADFARRQRPAALAVARLMLRGETDAEDVVQEALLRLWQRWDLAETPEHRRNLLLMIVRWQSASVLRSSQVRSVPCAEFEPAALGTCESAGDAALRRWWWDSVFEGLPQGLREVIREHLCGGTSLRELSDAYGLSPDALRARKSRAMPALRERVRVLGALA